MFCSKCGHELKNENVAYCTYCGASINGNRTSLNIAGNENAEKNKDKSEKINKRNIFIVVTIAIVITIVLKLLFFGKDENEKLIGTWVCTEDEEWVLSFTDDGKYYDSISYFLDYNDVGNWSIVSEGKLYFSCVGFSDTYDYKVSGKTLTIQVDDSRYYTYKKVK